jgi:hypothetical protein
MWNSLEAILRTYIAIAAVEYPNCTTTSAWKCRIPDFAIREILSKFIRDLGLWPALLISRFLTNVVPQKTPNLDALARASLEISTPKWGG